MYTKTYGSAYGGTADSEEVSQTSPANPDDHSSKPVSCTVSVEQTS